MINVERLTEAKRDQNRLQRFTEGASGVVFNARLRAEELFGRKVEHILGFPVRQKRLMQYRMPEWNEHLPQIDGIDTFTLLDGLVKEAEKAGDKPYDRATDSHVIKLKGRKTVVVRTDHASDFAKPGFLNYDSRAHVITGSESLVSAILGATDSIEAFTHLTYTEPGRTTREVPLFQRRTVTPLHKVFDELPNPFPPGAAVHFRNKQYTLEAKALPIPSTFIVPQVSFLGASERSNLDSMLTLAQRTGKRIVVVFKEGHEGIVRGFVQAAPGFDVYELEDSDKKKVKFVNGKRTGTRALPDLKRGTAQIVLMPVKGRIEGHIREGTNDIHVGISAVAGALGVFGIDVVESGGSASDRAVVPINFRDPGSRHVDGTTILQWFKDDPKRYVEYVRKNSIMPVQPIVVNVKKNSSPK